MLSDLLSRTNVIIVPRVPVPPLSSLGLPQFAAFENMDSAGITYNRTYFLRSDHAQLESIHFHELIHVIQWAHLGVERFLQLYALGLAQHGYSNSPLEVMARRHQHSFDSGTPPYAVEAMVHTEVDDLVQAI